MCQLIYASLVTTASADDIACIFLSEKKLKELAGTDNLALSHKNKFVHIIEGDSIQLRSLFRQIKEQSAHRYTMAIYEGDNIEMISCGGGRSEVKTNALAYA